MAGGTTKVVLQAIAGNGVITVAKGIGWFMTGSPSMMAETIHSLADTTNQLLIYVGIRHSGKGPSRLYPFGQGSARYLWNVVSAMGIFFIGFGVTLYHGIHALLTTGDHGSHEINWLPIGILAFAFLVEGKVFLTALKEVNLMRGKIPMMEYMRTSDDPTAVAILFEDGIAVIGVVLAVIGILLSNFFQSSIPDAIASIVIALLLGVMAIGLAIVNGRLLIGRSADPQIEKNIEKLLSKQPSVEKITSLNTRIVGSNQLRLSCEVEFHGSAIIDRERLSVDAAKIRSGEDPNEILVDSCRRTVRRVGSNINELEKTLYEAFPQLVAIDIEVH